jgi:Zn-finger nucleic acid-binding protein
MNRVNFGVRSGVVVDRCGDHGVWLDAGEMRQLMEWAKAGGRMLHQQVMERRREEEKRRQERRQRERAQRASRGEDGSHGMRPGAFGGRSMVGEGPDMISLLAQVAGWLRG